MGNSGRGVKGWSWRFSGKFAFICVGLVGILLLASPTLGAPFAGQRANSTANSERAKEVAFGAKFLNMKKSDGFARASFYRKGRTVNTYVLGFCGEFTSGKVRIKSRNFRKAITFSNGYGIQVKGRFSTRGKQIRGYVRVWSPKRKCDSGKKKFIARKKWDGLINPFK